MPMFGPANAGLVNPMTTAGDIIYGTTGGSPARLPIGSNGQILTLSGGLPAWQSAGNIATTPQSTTYSILTTDYLVICSGASWTMTLPTAVGVSGKAYQILHNGTSLSQVYTINTTSAQTVGGIASGSYALYTNGECLTIVSDGANWQILNHITNTAWVNSGANVIGATTTAPLKGTATIPTDKLWWRRVGTNMEARIEYVQTAAGTATVGTGDYLFTLPANVLINTSAVTVFTTVIGAGFMKPSNCVGTFLGSDSANSFNVEGCVFVYDSTHVRLGGALTGAGTSNSVNVMVSDLELNLVRNPTLAATYSVPIAGWQP